MATDPQAALRASITWDDDGGAAPPDDQAELRASIVWATPPKPVEEEEEEPGLIEKFFDSEVFGGVADKLGELREEHPRATSFVENVTPILAIPKAIGAAAGAAGALIDNPISDTTALKAGIEEGGATGVDAAIRLPAPIDIATLGVAGLARGGAVKGVQAVHRLRRAEQALDFSEGAYGVGQVQSGLEEGDPTKMGVGAARVALGGGTAVFGGPGPKAKRVIKEEPIPDAQKDPLEIDLGFGDKPTGSPEFQDAMAEMGPVTHKAGRPAARSALKDELRAAGRTDAELEGQSVSQLKEMRGETEGATAPSKGLTDDVDVDTSLDLDADLPSDLPVDRPTPARAAPTDDLEVDTTLDLDADLPTAAITDDPPTRTPRARETAAPKDEPEVDTTIDLDADIPGQHASRVKKRPVDGTPSSPSTGSPPDTPVGSSGLPVELEAKVRQALRDQKAGRPDAEARNTRLHYNQARIVRRWEDAANAGEVSGQRAQQETMRELEGIGARHQEVLGTSFEPQDMELLLELNRNWSKDAFKQLRAGKALTALQGRKQLAPAQIKILRDMLGRHVVGADLNPTLLGRLMEMVAKTSGSLRPLIASNDLSAPGRQGLILTVNHPIIATRAFRDQVGAWMNEKKFLELQEAIENNVFRDLQNSSGLHISRMHEAGETVEEAAQLGGAEEVFGGAADIVHEIPGVRRSERAYITYLNKMRSDVFNKMAHVLMRDGFNPKSDPNVFKKLAQAVNEMSGRGSLDFSIGGQKIRGEGAVPLLNTVFFAPRFMSSRLRILGALPSLYANYPRPIRKMMLRKVGVTIGAGLAALRFAQAMGAEVEMDARSSDFAKVKIGNTRLDIWGGFQPWVRVFAQIGSGQRKGLRSGQMFELGEGINPSRLEVLGRFFSQKASPVAGIGRDLLAGESAIGEELEFFAPFNPPELQFGFGRDVARRVLPLVYQDFAEVTMEGQAELLALTVPLSILGVGVQTFDVNRGRGQTGRRRGTPRENLIRGAENLAAGAERVFGGSR